MRFSATPRDLKEQLAVLAEHSIMGLEVYMSL